MSGYCSLQATSRAVRQRRAMHLAERGGGRGLVLEACEASMPVGAEFARHAPAHEGPAHRRRVGLQLRRARARIPAAARRAWWRGTAPPSSAAPSARRGSSSAPPHARAVDLDAEIALPPPRARRGRRRRRRLRAIAAELGRPAKSPVARSCASALVSSLQLVDEAGDHAEPLVPERGIGGVQAERRQQLLVPLGAAGRSMSRYFAWKPGWPAWKTE